MALVGWVSGCTVIWSSLFSVGNYLYGRMAYAAVLFYIMLMQGPTNEGHLWYAGRPKDALEHLGSTPQGIFVLHHALLAYPQWPVWSEIVGIADRKFGYHIGQKIHVNVADAQHPKSMKAIGWARQYKKSRVFCLESGHDNQCWANASFREVLRRGLLWCARKA